MKMDDLEQLLQRKCTRTSPLGIDRLVAGELPREEAQGHCCGHEADGRERELRERSDGEWELSTQRAVALDELVNRRAVARRDLAAKPARLRTMAAI